MKYEFVNGHKSPIVYCGNCHKKMVCDGRDGYGKATMYYMICDEKCQSWCRVQFDNIVAYGKEDE